MSDSWIAWKPRMDDPSNIWPLTKKSSSTDSAGTLKCCMTPGRSQKRTSTNLTSSFLMKRRTSSAFWNIHPPRSWRRSAVWTATLGGPDFPVVTLVFPSCYESRPCRDRPRAAADRDRHPPSYRRRVGERKGTRKPTGPRAETPREGLRREDVAGWLDNPGGRRRQPG